MANLTATSFRGFQEVLKNHRSGSNVKIGYETYISRMFDNQDEVWVWHYTTVIARYKLDRSGNLFVVFKDGGYRTIATKDRLRQLMREMGYDIFQNGRGWWWNGPDNQAHEWNGEILVKVERPAVRI